MLGIKKAQYHLRDVKLLNTPILLPFYVDQNVRPDQQEYEDTIVAIAKFASTVEARTDKDGDDTVFDLEAEIKAHPDALFVKCFAIKANEANDNGDYFSREELKRYYDTFVGCNVFTNHQNTDIEQSRGKIVHAWYDDERDGIMIIARVDASAYPQLARGIKEEYIVGTSMGCFLGHNRVQMADGTYCPIQDVQSGDLVITHLGNAKPVVNVQRHLDKENAPILHIGIQGIKDTIDCTPDHPFYVPVRQNICACGCGEKLSEDPNGDWIRKYQKKFKRGHYQKSAVSIKQVQSHYNYSWVRADELKIGDVICMPRTRGSRTSISPNMARLIGLFLAEGSFLKRKGQPVAIQFNLSLDEKDTLGKEICDLICLEYGKEPSVQIRTDRNTFCVTFSGRSPAEWFKKHCGEYSFGKRLSNDIIHQNDEAIKIILGAIIDGDGYKRHIANDNYVITTTSRFLRDQISTLLTRLGLSSSTTAIANGKSICLRKAADMESVAVDYAGVDTRRPSYSISIGSRDSALLSPYVSTKPLMKIAGGENRRVTDRYVFAKITSIAKSFNSEPVFTLEVEDDHSYVVEGAAVKNCQVQYSICSICHNRAETPDQYCGCIKERKTRKWSGRVECKYHEHGTEEECPVCGSKKGDKKKLVYKDALVFEFNYGLKFIENSFVVNPACHECGVTEIIDTTTLLSKVADIERRLPRLLKAAALEPVMCTDRQCVKIAGQKELQQLQDALNSITQVSQAMLQQKDQIDLEFLSDLVTVLADLQSVTDELTQQGYGRLPSPGDAGATTDMSAAAPGTPGAQPATAPMNPTPGGGSRVQSGPAGEVGTVTSPTASRRIVFQKMGSLIPVDEHVKQPPMERKAIQLPRLMLKTASNSQKLLNFRFKFGK